MVLPTSEPRQQRDGIKQGGVKRRNEGLFFARFGNRQIPAGTALNGRRLPEQHAGTAGRHRPAGSQQARQHDRSRSRSPDIRAQLIRDKQRRQDAAAPRRSARHQRHCYAAGWPT